MTSIFLQLPTDLWVARNELAFAIRDSYPVTEGHTLVIPLRPVATWFEATRSEQTAILQLVDVVKKELDEKFSPDGYNVGFNAGTAAGQTVPHLHVHVIPRYEGDSDDPRGGVRHVLPDRGNYKRVAVDWTRPPGRSRVANRAEPLTTGDPKLKLAPFLAELFGRARDVTIIAAFVQGSGLDELEPMFEHLLVNKSRLRIVTGDYLAITQADALQSLLDLQARTAAFAGAEDGETALQGRFEVRVIETSAVRRAFHPKAWIFRWGAPPGDGVAYVGSSNVSRSALLHGIEWNLRLERGRDPTGFDRVADAAEELWGRARPLDPEWLADYRLRARRTAHPLPLGDADDDAGPPPEPRDVQVEALEALKRSRLSGRERALVVLATGLGKTFLAAFDVREVAQTLGRPPRVLVLAHRRELLSQAMTTFRRILPDLRFTWCVGAASGLDGDIVFASVQKLSRPKMLDGVPPDYFDYVIIDEVHHATAKSYRNILAALNPGFLLGLTATPDRTDEADVLGLFDDHLPYRADLADGISRRLLVPFAYEGVRDTVDYAPIPWRSGRFDPGILGSAIQTQVRMETLWSAWQRLPGSRTLVFCASIDHAIFVRDWLRSHGVRIEAVHSGRDSFDRGEGLRQLESGNLDALCSVDLFNEGIDCKPVDRVVMLRPTESPVVFLQQLGRGLRIAAGKSQLQVIDFVGNHRVFLNRLRTLLSLGGQRAPLRAFLEGRKPPVLPAGCSIEVELEAKDLLRRLLPASSKNELVRVYRELRDSRGRRPTPGELLRLGLNPASVRTGHGSWFGFVHDEEDLSPAERIAFQAAEAWLSHLERTAMTKCFKMVVLEVLSEADAFRVGLPLDELARRSHSYLRRSPELLADLDGVKAVDDVQSPDPELWLQYWTVNPVRAWTTSDKRPGSRAWFELDDERLVPRLPFSGDEEAADALVDLTREVVDWRLARYRKRRQETLLSESDEGVASFRIKVLRNASGDPILHFGNRKDRQQLPRGETDVRLGDGSMWSFRFVKIACNVARPVGEARNRLPDLLRSWFGPDAGKAGTDLQVEFRRSPDGWWVEPVGARVVVLHRRDHVVAYPTLRAAAGQVADSVDLQGELVEPLEVRLPTERPDPEVFAVRATGSSMDGGKTPIRDGDWVLLRWARGRGLGAVQGRIALVAVGEPQGDRQFLLKRVVRTDSGLVLRSENRSFEELPVSESTQVIALLSAVVRPEQLAPPPGSEFLDEEIADAFGLSTQPRRPWSRVDGHLCVFVESQGPLEAPDRLRFDAAGRRPGETAFVFVADSDASSRYAGAATWIEAEGLWGVPAVDFDTWRRVGQGRSASRRLDQHWLELARVAAARLAGRTGAWVEARGRRCRVTGRSKSGGLRVDGGSGGFRERTVSLTDIAWVLCARDEAHRKGGLVDEARVNRLRYLDGTPKASTRWIDTGWALVLTQDLDQPDG